MLKRERELLQQTVARMNLLLHSVKPTHIRQDMAACVYELAELGAQEILLDDEDGQFEDAELA